MPPNRRNNTFNSYTKKELLFSGSDLHNWLPMDWKILNFMIKTQGANRRTKRNQNGERK
jgi:hypothetical protein